jgi:hypothetical protein
MTCKNSTYSDQISRLTQLYFTPILQPKISEDSFDDDIADAHNNHLCILFISITSNSEF